MTFPANHKTVILLDHCSTFNNPSQQSVDFDTFSKARNPRIIPLAPATKSLWTCNVEASVEYCRILYDIFPSKKLVTLISADSDATLVNSWSVKQQNLPQIMMGFAVVGPPKSSNTESSNLFNGINRAVEYLCEPSVDQLEIINELGTSNTDYNKKLENNTRIIILTNIKNEPHLQSIEDCLQKTIQQHNLLVTQSKRLVIDHCDVDIVHTMPIGHQPSIKPKPSRQCNSFMSSEVHVTESGKFVAFKMVQLAIKHFNLSSTTVTGIPMKEEQNGSSSSNYDVEILHCDEAHEELERLGQVEGVVIPSKEGLPTNTVTLKWCTPKSNVVELHPSSGAFRISPVDVNSRPSSCLTNFLLSGRSVMLEQPRKTGSKILSHMLTSHGGEIYIHVLNICRSSIEDPPSISEGAGGRVTDYRIKDFGEFMKQNTLAPVKSCTEETLMQTPIEKAETLLSHLTRFWPLGISESIIVNMASNLDPLPTLLLRETLNNDEVLTCKKVILSLVGMETNNDSLPIPNVARGKGPKREEQYKQMWTELEKFVKLYSNTSVNHQKVLECVRECRQMDDSKKDSRSKMFPEEEPVPMETEYNWADLHKTNKVTTAEKTADKSGLSSKLSATNFVKPIVGQHSLLSIWNNRTNENSRARCNEFFGRKEHKDGCAELYIHLKDAANQDGKTETNGTQ